VHTHFMIANMIISSNHAIVLVDLHSVKLHFQSSVIFHNNFCYNDTIHLRGSKIYFVDYIEFSANKGNGLIKYFGRTYYYAMLTENVILNITHNSLHILLMQQHL